MCFFWCLGVLLLSQQALGHADMPDMIMPANGIKDSWGGVMLLLSTPKQYAFAVVG